MPQTFSTDHGRIRQLTADEATVMVWRNDSAAKIFRGAGRFGHASIMLRTDQISEIARYDLEQEQSELEKLVELADNLSERMDTLRQQLKLTKSDFIRDMLQEKLAKKDQKWDRLWDEQMALKKRIALWNNPKFIRWYYLAEAEEGSFKHVHISWWPSEGVGHELKDMRRAQPGEGNPTVWSDVTSEMSGRTRDRLQRGEIQPRAGQVNLGKAYSLLDEELAEDWGQEPDWVISVPAFGAANRYWGLNVARMWSWFTEYRDQSVGADYKMISTTKSCAGLAMRALRQGGCEAFTKQPVSHFYVLPNEVAKYALELRGSIVELNALAMRFEFNVLQPWLSKRSATQPRSGGAQPHKKPDLWTADQWRANRQPHARGPFQVGDHLEAYHSTDANKDWAKKFRLLGAIFWRAVEEIEDDAPITTPTPRIENLIIVCAQCLNVIRNPQSWARA